jgi:lipopolysaccharide export system protein LptA
MLRIPPLALPLVLLLLGVNPSAAQERVCNFEAVGRTEQIDQGGSPLILLHDPFTVRCTDGAVLRANSGRLIQAIRELYLSGDVYFQDAEQTLTAEEATYNSGTGRLRATGNVEFVDRSEGTTLRGPELLYDRATDDRPEAHVTATGRPTLTMRRSDDGPDAEPIELVADRVFMVGRDDLSAFGAVVVTRTDFRATGGEARYDAAIEELEMRQDARVTSEEYELAGEVVRARMAEGAVEWVHARTRAALRGEDLLVTAPDLEIFFESQAMQRAIARSPDGVEGGRPRATSRTFEIEADSLDATFVEDRLDQVHAVGSARGESVDTVSSALAPTVAADPSASLDLADEAREDDVEDREALAAAPLGTTDWIRGDTVIAYFVPAPQPDGEAEGGDLSIGADDDGEEGAASRAVELSRLTAMGSAQSLYRMRADGEPAGSTERRNLNFLVGDAIELVLEDGELSVANVTGLRRGIYLEANAADPGAGPSLPVLEESPPAEPEVSR